MDRNQIFAQGLGLEAPWRIVSSNLDVNVIPHRLDLRIEADLGALYPCPECGMPCKAHDFAERTWRHLNFFQHHCYVTPPVPRTDCPGHSVKTVQVPWARKGSAFIMFFEAMVMLPARELPVAALARYAGEIAPWARPSCRNAWRAVRAKLPSRLTKDGAIEYWPLASAGDA